MNVRQDQSFNGSHVVLVHGLWMPSASMALLARRLEARRFATHLFDYRGRAPFGENVAALARYLRTLGTPAHLVAHSLGGVLALNALQEHPDLSVLGSVFLGSPVRGSLSARSLGGWAAGRWLLGASTPCWREHRSNSWPVSAPLGVIAGSAPWGMGRLLGMLPKPNDGVVYLEETEVAGMTERVIVRMNHSGMLVAPGVSAQVIAFLSSGRFAPA